MKTCNCQILPEFITGKTIEEIADFTPSLQLIKIEEVNWVKHYQCSYCGQRWDEIYEMKGHGEIPRVRKVN